MRNGDLRSLKDTLGHGKPSENTPLSTGRTDNNWDAGDVTSISDTNDVVKGPLVGSINSFGCYVT